MIIETIKAIIFAGIPVAAIAYYFTLLTRNKTPHTAENVKQLKQQLKQQRKKPAQLNALTTDQQDQDNVITTMLYHKWLYFGGGFYGVMAFISYIHIEIIQIMDFMRTFSSLQNFIDNIGLRMLVNFFIEALMNLIQAFLWFIYWYKYLPIGSFWLWIIVVFVAYSSATKYALIKTTGQ